MKDMTENLLKEIKKTHHKYVERRKANGINLFTLLRRQNEEVGLHSKFISELLNPKGQHGEGPTFLKLFLEEAELDHKITNQAQLADVTCTVEKWYGKIDHELKTGGRIDIILEGGALEDHPIVIENKIDAGDQPDQLLRYWNIVGKKNVGEDKVLEKESLVYLTREGKDADKKSCDELEYSKVSYRKNIFNWIQNCIKECRSAKQVIILKDYLEVVEAITENGDKASEIEDIEAIIQRANNSKIKNRVDLKQHAEKRFWKNLEKKVNLIKGCTVSLNMGEVDDFIVKRQNNKRAYPLIITIEDKIEISIERSYWPICWGLKNISGNNIDHIKNSFESNTKQPFDFDFRKIFNDPIDFSELSNYKNPEFLHDLLESDKRAEIVKRFAAEIHSIIDLINKQ
jgi:hypothetical protein